MGFERAATVQPAPLIDPFRRAITYLRVSVTDRCDFRCVYCMSENMAFLPKQDLLTLEELDRLCGAFVARGVRKLRLTGGEPLVRRGIMTLVRSLSRHLGDGLDELTVTTNGSQLPKYAAELADCGVKRINVSLDTLDPDKFRAITRWGELDKVMAGIDAAQDAGLAVKINAVALKGVNEDELADLVDWSHGRGMDLTIIEVMPLGDIDESRLDQYLPLSMVRARLAERYTMQDIDHRTGGPARYVRVAETGGRLGFITPLTHNFCESCNRVRLTCTGTLYMCLGQEDAADLRTPLARVREQRPGQCGDRRRDPAQAEGARLRHRSPRRTAGGIAPHERDRWMISRRTLLSAAIVALPAGAAAQQETWATYRNTRFGTTIEYPARFRPGRPPENNDGLSFVAADGATLQRVGLAQRDGTRHRRARSLPARKPRRRRTHHLSGGGRELAGALGNARRTHLLQTLRPLAPQRDRQRIRDQLSGRPRDELRSDRRAPRRSRCGSGRGYQTP